MRYLFCFGFLLLSFPILAQSTADWWFFGRGGGLHFMGSEPVSVGGKSQGKEGCASISDTLGNLLFYTDGSSVWNKSQRIMSNGRDLAGHISSSMAAIIVPFPKHPSQYYIFTTDAVERGTNGLQYSVIDMNLDEGRGDIIANQKNILIKKDVPEKINAVPTADNTGYWIVTHNYPGNEYFAYKLTANGLDREAVVSEEGSTVHDFGKMAPVTQGTGFLKFSPDGKTLALGYDDLVDGKAWGRLELFDFDRETGKLSNFKKINIGEGWVHGFEFSPNGKVIYVASLEKILQIDLVEKKMFVAFDYKTDRSEQKWFFSMQLAPNGRIYIGELATGKLSVITHPDEIGEKCGFMHAKIFTNQPSVIGLPIFVPSLLQLPPPTPLPTKDNISPKPETSTYTSPTIKIDTLDDSFCYGSFYTFPNGKTTQDTGYFTGYSPWHVYHLHTQTKGYINVYQYITIHSGEKYRLPDGKEVQDPQMYISTIASNRGCDSMIFTLLTVLPKKVVSTVHFAYNSAVLEDKETLILQEWIAILQQQKSLKIELRGHTDTDATEIYNQNLSVKRVKAVKDFLLSKGITDAQIKEKALGENEALFPSEANETEKAENRRVEIRIISE
jgi:outer membrane protein OmpA-like peptidoglycan-associated protein